MRQDLNSPWDYGGGFTTLADMGTLQLEFNVRSGGGGWAQGDAGVVSCGVMDCGVRGGREVGITFCSS
jgi:hypothetical protein